MKTADYYRRLPYTRRVRVESDEGGEYFVAFIPELPGVEASGATDMDARAALSAAFEDYLAAMLEWGEEIPEPTPWPESMGFSVEGREALEYAPATIVAFGSAHLEGAASSDLEEHIEEFGAVRELTREMETSAA